MLPCLVPIAWQEMDELTGAQEGEGEDIDGARAGVDDHDTAAPGPAER